MMVYYYLLIISVEYKYTFFFNTNCILDIHTKLIPTLIFTELISTHLATKTYNKNKQTRHINKRSCLNMTLIFLPSVDFVF